MACEGIIELTELAAKDLLGYLNEKGKIRNGALDQLGVELFVRVHELGGLPISSRFIYNDEEHIGSDGKPSGIVVRELGCYQDLIKLAEFYGLDADSLNKILREDSRCSFDIEFRHEENRAIFRLSDRFGGVKYADAVLYCYAVEKGLQNLERLLEKSEITRREEIEKLKRRTFLT